MRALSPAEVLELLELESAPAIYIVQAIGDPDSPVDELRRAVRASLEPLLRAGLIRAGNFYHAPGAGLDPLDLSPERVLEILDAAMPEIWAMFEPEFDLWFEKTPEGQRYLHAWREADLARQTTSDAVISANENVGENASESRASDGV